MRFTISSEELKIFQTIGYFELENLLSEQEAFDLIAAIQEVKKNTPGYAQENFYRSIPFIRRLVRQKGWGQIAAELLHKKPLRIQIDRFFETKPLLETALEDDACGILINLKKRNGFFFKLFPTKDELYKGIESCYFLLILTAKHLPDRLNPVVFR
jgi:hypothetical protein